MFRVTHHRRRVRHRRWQYRLLRRCFSPSTGGGSFGATIATLAARGARVSVRVPFAALSAAATATTTTTPFAVLSFLDCTRLRLGDGRRLVGSCTRFLHWPRFARRTLLLRLARSLTWVIARLVALPVPGLTVSPCGWRRALRGPRLRHFALLVASALSTLTRLSATLVALIPAPITVLPSAPGTWRV